MTHWELYREMGNVGREMEQVFGRLGFGRAVEPGLARPLTMRGYPRIEVRDETEYFTVTALIPGIEPKELEMTLLGNTLTLSGERKLAAEANVTWHRRERGDGKFMRTIEMPVAIDAEQVRADFNNGVLTVKLPKVAADRPKRIEIAI